MKLIILSLVFFTLVTPAFAAEPTVSDRIASWLTRTFRVPQALVIPSPQSVTPSVVEGSRPCAPGPTPVCGLDGKTYANRCEAGDAPIALEGVCTTPSPPSSTPLHPSPPPKPFFFWSWFSTILTKVQQATPAQPSTSTPRQFLPMGEVPAPSPGPGPSLLDLFREVFLKKR